MTEKQKKCIDRLRNYFENKDDIAYVEMLNKLKKDAKFEKLIQAVSVDRMMGANSHNKYNIKWE